MERLVACPACGSTEVGLKLNTKDFSLTRDTFSIDECHQCGLWFTNPRPTIAEIGRYYEFPEYISHQEKAPGLLNRIYRIARTWTTRGKVKLLTRVNGTTQKTLLDYGCGTGFFLGAAKLSGWQVEGVEINATARNQAAEQLGQEVRSSIDELAPSQKFSVITLWHVLEHVHNLHWLLDKVMQHLAEKGTLIIAVPNPQAADAQAYAAWWAALDVPRHLYHFSSQSLRKLMHKHGAVVKQTLPMPLDAYYVSMLSEKHRAGSTLDGLWNGWRSNQKAAATGQWSSLIYVIEREEKR